MKQRHGQLAKIKETAGAGMTGRAPVLESRPRTSSTYLVAVVAHLGSLLVTPM